MAGARGRGGGGGRSGRASGLGGHREGDDAIRLWNSGGMNSDVDRSTTHTTAWGGHGAGGVRRARGAR
jgi:hypothetical protein